MATFVTLKSRKGTVYQAVIRKKGHKPIKRTFSTKGEAKFWAAEQESLILRKKYKDPRLAEAVYLDEALNRYHEYGKNILKKSPSTLDREQYSHRHITRILGAGTPLSEIESTEISRYQSERLAENASSSSVRQELAMLSRVFRLANGAWGLSIDNPLTYIDRVPAGPGRERFLSTKEVRIILEEAKNTKNIKFYPQEILTFFSSGDCDHVFKIYKVNTSTGGFPPCTASRGSKQGPLCACGCSVDWLFKYSFGLKYCESD